MEKITKNTLLTEILLINPDTADTLMKVGLHCIGCPMAVAETLEEGCKAHGMKSKDIDELIKKLNKK